ncbi:cystathionine beta-lyase [Paraoerskovia sediminicola]|uniref:cysteine-S-conjugate beta-lyase n=1 Tax=Paraoerskovia sediminicola TaxID=1138587 RepID=A0ABN6XA44_9CELL|nr:aminotransferase class I/II-fold pyridoxal phosphate-dependent enzyme [Paraoerskovia sediminicola]BDZ41714.1 cystathionine beta-lyase [Paraoerskovia sediminicola]
MKWRAYAPDVLPLWVAEMDVQIAPAVQDAVARAMRDGDTGYNYGPVYQEALAEFAEQRWGWSFDVAHARPLADVMVGITEVLRVLTRPGEAVVVSPPVYPPFFAFPADAGREVVEAPLGADGRLDLGVLETVFANVTGAGTFGRGSGHGKGAAYLLCNPHNPTGVAHTRPELEALLALAQRYGVRVVSDEIHAPIAGHLGTDGPRYTPLLTVEGSSGAVAVLSASKAWNLAGLKTAVAVAGPDAAADLARIPEVAYHGVSHLAVIAHSAALRDGVDWLDSTLAGIARNKRLLVDLLADHLPTVPGTPTEATYFAWLDCRALPGRAGEDPFRFFHDEARVALNDGTTFGTGGAGFVRMNLATSPAVLTEAVERMGRAVGGRG